jgi:hypothetical protein
MLSSFLFCASLDDNVSPTIMSASVYNDVRIYLSADMPIKEQNDVDQASKLLVLLRRLILHSGDRLDLLSNFIGTG